MKNSASLNRNAKFLFIKGKEVRTVRHSRNHLQCIQNRNNKTTKIKTKGVTRKTILTRTSRGSRNNVVFFQTKDGREKCEITGFGKKDVKRLRSCQQLSPRLEMKPFGTEPPRRFGHLNNRKHPFLKKSISLRAQLFSYLGKALRKGIHGQHQHSTINCSYLVKLEREIIELDINLPFTSFPCRVCTSCVARKQSVAIDFKHLHRL